MASTSPPVSVDAFQAIVEKLGLVDAFRPENLGLPHTPLTPETRLTGLGVLLLNQLAGATLSPPREQNQADAVLQELAAVAKKKVGLRAKPRVAVLSYPDNHPGAAEVAGTGAIVLSETHLRVANYLGDCAAQAKNPLDLLQRLRAPFLGPTQPVTTSVKQTGIRDSVLSLLLGHELTHFLHDDSGQKRAYAAELEAGPPITAVAKLVQQRDHARGSEWAADLLGLELSLGAGASPLGLVHWAFQAMSDRAGGTHDDEHPPSFDRYERLYGRTEALLKEGKATSRSAQQDFALLPTPAQLKQFLEQSIPEAPPTPDRPMQLAQEWDALQQALAQHSEFEPDS